MNICILYKGENSVSDVRMYIHKTHTVQEVRVPFGAAHMSSAVDAADVMIFDVIQNGGDLRDVDWVTAVRQDMPTIPILLASGQNENAGYRELMLNNGVDGCVQLPFSKAELQIRLEKLSQKKTLLFACTKIAVADVSMDLSAHTVEKDGTEIRLTKTEYSILFHLFLHKGSLVSVDDLLVCLGEPGTANSSAIYTHILNLRRKIKDINLIKTIPRYGFVLHEDVYPGVRMAAVS